MAHLPCCPIGPQHVVTIESCRRRASGLVLLAAGPLSYKHPWPFKKMITQIRGAQQLESGELLCVGSFPHLYGGRSGSGLGGLTGHWGVTDN